MEIQQKSPKACNGGLLHVDTAEHAFNKCNYFLKYKIPQKCELVIEQLKPGVRERQARQSEARCHKILLLLFNTLHQRNDELITVCCNIVAK